MSQEIYKYKKKTLKPLYDDDDLNYHLLGDFHKKIKSQPRTNATINKINEKKTEYSLYNKKLLTMEKTEDEKFKVTAEKNFTGTLIVYRKDSNGRIDMNKADIIQYKEGKPVRVSSPKEGKAMIANLEEIKQRAKNPYSYYIRKKMSHIKMTLT